MCAVRVFQSSRPILTCRKNNELAIVRAKIGNVTFAERFLPNGLKLSEPPMATYFNALYPDTAMGPYHEAGVLLDVDYVGIYHGQASLQNVTSKHCIWMLVDSDAPMMTGRATLGYPKKMADAFNLDIRYNDVRMGDHLTTTVDRVKNFTTFSIPRSAFHMIIEGDIAAGLPESPPPDIFGGDTYNVWPQSQVYSRPDGTYAGIPSLLKTVNSELKHDWYRLQNASMTFPDPEGYINVFDPIDQLLPEVVEGWYAKHSVGKYGYDIPFTALDKVDHKWDTNMSWVRWF